MKLAALANKYNLGRQQTKTSAVVSQYKVVRDAKIGWRSLYQALNHTPTFNT